MLGTDLEKVTDDEIFVEIFPNRPDMLSEQGFARAFSSFIGMTKGLSEFDVKPSKEKVIIDKSAKDVRPYTACAIVKDIKLDDEKIREIIQIQEKLHITYGRHRKKAAIGIYPYEKIKPPITFKADKPENIVFQPLEEKSDMDARQILADNPTGREYAPLLEGLDKYPFFVDSEGKILSMPPVINSHETGRITEDTKEIFIECSGFDYHTLAKCLNILVTAMNDMGGKIFSMDLEYSDQTITSPDLRPSEMEIDYDYVKRLLGVELSCSEIDDCLMSMGYGVSEGKALVPCYRTDVLHPIDLVEDVAIAYGYENFEPKIPNVATIGHEDDFVVFKRKISGLLMGLGFIETSSYNITDDNTQRAKMCSDIPVISLSNAMTSEYDTMRAWMIPSLMSILHRNKHHEYPQNIYEIGTVFKKGKTETGTVENDKLGVVLCGEGQDFTRIKQVLDYIFANLGAEYSVRETEHPSFIEGRVGRASYKDKDIAYVGELHPKVLENFELEMPASALELNLTELYRLVYG